MSRKKYTDFAESAPIELECKQAPGNTRMYVQITCPHCASKFVDIPVELIMSTKASKCLQHLRVCTKFKGTLPIIPEKKPPNGDVDRDAIVERQSEEIKRLKMENMSLEREKVALQEENASIEAEKTALRDIAVKICEEDMYNCFFDFGAGASSSDVQARMNTAVKAWGKARQAQTLARLNETHSSGR